MKTPVLFINLLLLSSLFVGCEYFSTSTYTPQQIKKASQWSDEDQTPGFESCQDEAEEDRFSCFKNTISSTVNNAFYAQELISNQAVDQEIVLEIQIDKEGVISLLSIENASTVLDAIPSLSVLLEEAIESLPTALPATKTNVGVKVDSQLKLPIRVIANPQ